MPVDQPQNNGRARLTTFRGETLPLADHARRHGIKPDVVYTRLKKLGWTIEDALSTPPQEKRPEREITDEINDHLMMMLRSEVTIETKLIAIELLTKRGL
ncbi:hypothetical protein JNW90_13720 [Micromonospora sp. STR1s_5]|nr:hypothetical protein [Micromonospora sp. STR1s_5]